jgi:hypothetical protein
VPNEPVPVDVGNVSGYVRDYIAAGLKPTEALREFRAAGGAIQDSRWFSLYGQITDTIARQPSFLALNPYVLPSPSEYGTWATGRGGQYATQVSIQLRDRDTGLYTTQLATYFSNDPHEPAEAEQWAMDTFGASESEADYGVTVMGATATAVWQTVPYGS